MIETSASLAFRISAVNRQISSQRSWYRLRQASVLSQWSITKHHARALNGNAQKITHIPFRKQLKDAEKRRRALKRDGKDDVGSLEGFESAAERARKDAMIDEWDLTVGVEIHAQLNTDRKLFSASKTSTDDEPNSNVSVFDLAYPGSQQKLQKETLIPALRAAIALNCDVQQESRFDRKHYFYQDQPAGYQITQYYAPFATEGRLTLSNDDGLGEGDGHVTIGIQQIQMEQDTAKSTIQPSSTALLDYNRVGYPLIEIITYPHMHTPYMAAACVKQISSILHSVNAVTTGMELGGLRADVNVSVSPKGSMTLGQRVEIKNLSSFQAVQDAVVAERDRQIEVLESGGTVEGETRGWTLGSTETQKLRGKEGEVDYRYMPDPDIAPLIIDQSLIDHITNTMPPLQDATVDNLVSKSRLTLKDARTLVMLDDGERLDYFDEVVESLRQLQTQTDEPADSRTKMQISTPGQRPAAGKQTMSTKCLDRTVVNWVLHELGGLLNTARTPFSAELVTPQSMACLLHNLERGRITRPKSKQILASIFNGDKRDVDEIIQADSPNSHMEHEHMRAMAEQLVKDNADKVNDIMKKGQRGKFQWFMGQMMRLGKGHIQPSQAEVLLKEVLRLGR